jgi:hypothetical protein
MDFLPSSAKHLFLAGLFLLCCTSCTVVSSPAERRQEALRLVEERGWERLDIEAAPFILTAFMPRELAKGGHTAAGKTLTIYLEGDGLAWLTHTQPSSDPTPMTPMALLLAQAQKDGPVATLARPCQYTTATVANDCDSRYWTSHRFAPEVIAATDQAISRLKTLSKASSLRLVGYSGGGAVAVLVAVRRNDVQELITVAGNLDHVAWTRLHHLAPLNGSLNPMDAAPALARLSQRHFVGSTDQVIPASLAQGFLAKQGKPDCASLILVEGLDHRRGWPERWPELLRSFPPFPQSINPPEPAPSVLLHGNQAFPLPDVLPL